MRQETGELLRLENGDLTRPETAHSTTLETGRFVETGDLSRQQ